MASISAWMDKNAFGSSLCSVGSIFLLSIFFLHNWPSTSNCLPPVKGAAPRCISDPESTSQCHSHMFLLLWYCGQWSTESSDALAEKADTNETFLKVFLMCLGRSQSAFVRFSNHCAATLEKLATAALNAEKATSKLFLKTVSTVLSQGSFGLPPLLNLLIIFGLCLLLNGDTHSIIKPVKALGNGTFVGLIGPLGENKTMKKD